MTSQTCRKQHLHRKAREKICWVPKKNPSISAQNSELDQIPGPAAQTIHQNTWMSSVEGDITISHANHPSAVEVATPPRTSRRESNDGTLVPQCTQSSCCINEIDENKFQCATCKRYVHYRCTALPLYQIHLFTSKSYRNYICINCTNVPEHLTNVIPRPPPPVASKEVAELQTTVKEKQMEVDVLADTNRLLQAKIKQITAELNNSTKEHKKGKEEFIQLQSKAKIMNTGIKKYEEKIAGLQSSIDSKDKELETERRARAPKSAEDTITTLTAMMAKKFDEVEKNLKESLLTEVEKNNKALEEKINEVVSTNKSFADAVTNSETSAAQTAPRDPPTHDFRAIIRAEHNEQLAEETEKKSRSGNLVIHGFPESISTDKNEAKHHDEEFVGTFLKDLGLQIEYRSTFRLGKKNDTSERSKRPIKVTMNSDQEKDRVMANLKELKGKDKYKGISVTDDHTIKDRNTIKEWVEKAKSANANEAEDSIYEWKVRGSPKNGMCLKKLKKRITAE